MCVCVCVCVCVLFVCLWILARSWYVPLNTKYGYCNVESAFTQRKHSITCVQKAKQNKKSNNNKKCMKNWRPLSLLNTTYNIVSACIANRLKTMLRKIIQEDQQSLMKGRYIGENMRLLYGALVNTEEENISGRYL